MSDASRELVLFAENDAGLYRSRIVSIIQNLNRKITKGTYDPVKALTLWKYAADDAAQRYTKEFGGSGHGSYGSFSPADRREAAKGLAESFDEELVRKNPRKRAAKNSRAMKRRKNPATGTAAHMIKSAAYDFKARWLPTFVNAMKKRHRIRWTAAMTKRHLSHLRQDYAEKLTPFQAAKHFAEQVVPFSKFSDSLRKNPAGRPLTPAGKHCVIAAVERATGDVGYFNGTHLQPSRDKAILYPSSLVAMKEAKRLGIRKAGLTVVVIPAGWDAKRLRNELDGVKPNPLSRKEIATAARKFETFTGHRATTVREVKMKVPRTGFLLGPVRDISYIATRDGETSVYRHEFKANSRPSLVAAVDGSTAILAGGRYRVTADRGIVDK